jgi:hypothetical protein
MRGLHQRTLQDGSVRYEARLRIDGKDRRIPLDATTAYDAVREFNELRADRDRDDIHETAVAKELEVENARLRKRVEELEHILYWQVMALRRAGFVD